MKLFKSVMIAFSLMFALASISTTAIACEAGRTCFGPTQATDIVLGHIATAIKSAEDGENGPTVNAHVRMALKASKEINVSDKIDVARSRANGHLKKARTAFKKSKIQEGEDHLGMAEEAFTNIKQQL